MLRTADADSPGITFPPPFIYLGFLLAGAVLEWFRPVGFGAVTWQPWAGGVLIVLGVALMLAGASKFRRAGTNIHPNRPSSVLVIDGPWRYTRNPLYLSLTLMTLGIGLAANSLWIVALVVPPVLIIRYAVIAREERYLEAKFGEPYRHYKASVRRWI
jgi:protein-S-isoprenylcysteine O-methyltransferase Ste14